MPVPQVTEPHLHMSELCQCDVTMSPSEFGTLTLTGAQQALQKAEGPKAILREWSLVQKGDSYVVVRLQFRFQN